VRPAALVFLAVLAAAAAAWAFAVLPVNGIAADLASRISKEDIAGRVRLAADPPPTAQEAAEIEKALARLAPPAAAATPKGLAEDTPGAFVGRLPWEEVQALLAWAADQPRPVLEIEVRAVAEDPARASCRVVLGQ